MEGWEKELLENVIEINQRLKSIEEKLDELLERYKS